MEELRTCMECNKRLQGRTDKKFCQDSCRNNYNNRKKSGKGNWIGVINTILKKNRRLLEELLPATCNSMRVSKGRLEQTGFNFHYHTHQFVNAKGKTYRFCYEYGYLPVAQDSLLIVRSLESKVPERNFDLKLPVRHFEETTRIQP